MIIIITAAIALIAVYIIQKHIYLKHGFDDMDYRVSLSASEVFEGDDIYLFEEFTNAKALPVPYAKVDTELPDGMLFRIIEQDGRGNNKERLTRHIQSLFVLKNEQIVRRRWRVKCLRPGVYTPGAVMIVINDVFGFNAHSKKFDSEGRGPSVVVLPRTVKLEEFFTSSPSYSGEIPVNRSIWRDPMLISGSREYNTDDPMNKINWKSSAVHGRLMVRVEDYTQNRRFNIVLNMQSRDIEPDPHTQSIPAANDLCIKVAASLLDLVSADNIEVRIIANTPPHLLRADCAADDEIGRDILISRPYRGKLDMIESLRLLATLPRKISCPIEKMLDHIVQNPHLYESGGNLIMVSPYLSERMVNFAYNLRRIGVHVAFYITTTNQNVLEIPGDIEVHFKAYD